MKKTGKQGTNETKSPNYGRVRIEGLRKSRKGKHHDFMAKIMEDLRGSESGFAVQIPIAAPNKISIPNLRSAVIRAAAKENMKIMTSSDDKYFYAWKAENST